MRITKAVLAILATVMTTNLFAQAAADAGEFRREGNSFNTDAYVAGVRAGMTDVEQLGDPVAGFGLFVDYAMNDDFLVGGAIDYWERSSGTLTDNRLFVSDVSLAANAKYVMSQVPIAVKPFVLAGASLHRINSEEETEALGIRETDTSITNEFGVDVGAGLMYRVQQRVDILGEARYRNILGGTAYDQLAFAGGVSYQM